MDYAQKYRVERFVDIKGNDSVINLLKRRVVKKIIPDFIAFYGIPGTCKTSLSYVLVKAVKCLHPTADGEPCNQCSSCIDINNSLYANNQSLRGSNIYVYSMAQEETQDENIKAILALLKAPNLRNTERFIIINELHNCSFKKQQNFLTPFEAIPKGTHIIITTTDYNTKIAEGIRSRAKAYQLVKPSVEEVVDRLATVCDLEGFKVTRANLKKLARIKDCNMRECLNALEDISVDPDSTWDFLLKEYTKVLEDLIVFIKAAKSGVIGLIPYVNDLDNAVDFVKGLPDALFKAISLKDVADQIVEPDLRKRLNEQTASLSIKKLNDLIRSLTGLGHITDSEAKRILFIVGCEMNEEIFQQVTHSDIDNSLSKEAKTDFRDTGAKVYSAADCMVSPDKEKDGKVSVEGVMSFIQNNVGEANILDIEGDGEEEEV